MTRDRLIVADASTTNGADFFAAVTGRPRKTKAEREAEYRADVERYITAIENGLEALVPPPFLHECKRVITLREQVNGDPLLRKDAA
jgi:hypothetical protein